MAAATLILALSLTGQCANGQCATQAYRSAFRFAAPAPTYAYATPAPVAPVKSWRPLSSHPGYLGYGSLNASGQLVVEWHVREGSTDVRAGRVPDEPCGVTGCGCGCSASKACECVTEVPASVGVGAKR